MQIWSKALVTSLGKKPGQRFCTNYMGDLFDRPFNPHIGYRYEETDVTSSAESQSYTN